MSSEEALRAQIDALAGEISAAKKQYGAADERTKDLVARMAQLRQQLPQNSASDAKKKEKLPELSYFDQRVQMVHKLKEHAYPHKFDVAMTIPQFRAKYSSAVSHPDDRATETTSIAGRVLSKRSSGSKLHFLTLQGDGEILQIISTLTDFTAGAEAFAEVHHNVKRGDIVGIVGVAGMSKTGEFSMMAVDLKLLSTCFHMLPDEHFGLATLEQRFRQRYLDFIVNRQNYRTFVSRAKIIKFVRDFFDARDFVEVETPVLNMIAGGAAARPFVTHHNELNQRMYLRIAPELFLKELVVGGMDRVYELGRQFRNEGIDHTHNPEFTSVEAYWAYKDYNDMMAMTEDLLHDLAVHLHGSPMVRYAPKDLEGNELPAVTFNFNKPFKRLYIIPELERRLNIKFPADLESDETNKWLIDTCRRFKAECNPPFTIPRLIDALIAAYLEPECTDPTFICDHPRVMSPLAKWHRGDPRLTERFELFVNKKELCNAYTELNNPLVQREEFMKQMANREKGDDESMPLDEGFLMALEHALPPTGGWGMGIDRLVMFMTSQSNIKEVLLFPAMKPEGRGEMPLNMQLNGQGVPMLRLI